MATPFNEVRLPLGTEERPFRLGVGEWRAIQTKCDVGPLELIRRLARGDWRVDDVRETLLQGLLGGGMDATLAGVLIRSTVDATQITRFVGHAQQVAMAALSIPDDDDSGEKTPAKKTRKTRSRAGKSASPASTPPGN